jgi:hypothetical protein
MLSASLVIGRLKVVLADDSLLFGFRKFSPDLFSKRKETVVLHVFSAFGKLLNVCMIRRNVSVSEGSHSVNHEQHRRLCPHRRELRHHLVLFTLFIFFIFFILFRNWSLFRLFRNWSRLSVC